jgi:type VI secretion system protein ImpA
MVTPPSGIDIDALLAPIPGPAATGVDLRQDFSATSLYFRLRDARAEARDAERQADASDRQTNASGDNEVAPPPQWRTVQLLAVEALTTRTKDLEIAAWLTEALVRSSGLVGLAVAAAILGGLVDRYWDGLYPMPDEDGLETRVAPVAGLSGQGVDGTLMQPLRKIVMFRRSDGPFSYWQYEQSFDLARITDARDRQKRVDAGVLTFDDFERVARAAAPDLWSALQRKSTDALSAWTALGVSLDTLAGQASPSTGRVRDLLLAMQKLALRFAPAETANPNPPGITMDGPIAPKGPDHPIPPVVPNVVPPGGISGRDQALGQLGEIAAWFKRNEPHSPLAYTLEEAVRRGRMSWPQLLEELMPDQTGRHALLNSLGIKPTPEDGG